MKHSVPLASLAAAKTLVEGLRVELMIFSLLRTDLRSSSADMTFHKHFKVDPIFEVLE